MTVENKATVVTGGANGIGKGIASVFAQEGADVAVLDIDIQAAEQAAEEIGTDEGEVIAVEGDVTDEDSMNVAVETVEHKLGGVDVLVANTGIYPAATLGEMDVEDWEAVQDVNLKGPFLCVKACLPLLRGDLIVVSCSRRR